MTSAYPDNRREYRESRQHGENMNPIAGAGPSEAAWSGVFAILCTPFRADGQLDPASLRREIGFCLESGAHGIVALVNASEFWTLSDDERLRIAELVLGEVQGRVPTVIGVTAGSADWAIRFARHAQDAGASAVIAMPPNSHQATPLECFRYYERLTSALEIPLFIQNHDAPVGTRMSPELVTRIVRELPHADWIKEETVPAGHAISYEIESCGPKLRGIMGGLAGRYIFDEYARGARGTMPACESTDIHVRIWNLLASGQEDEARALFARLLPLLNFEAASAGVYQTVLHWRGVFESDFLRSNLSNPLDAADRRELATIVHGLRDLMTIAPLNPALTGKETAA
jgi:dihydrodipicolinate synthase/N-acetylneuraminate lyase